MGLHFKLRGWIECETGGPPNRAWLGNTVVGKSVQPLVEEAIRFTALVGGSGKAAAINPCSAKAVKIFTTSLAKAGYPIFTA